MKEQLISFETAKLAKEKGFPTLNHIRTSYYNHLGELNGDVIELIKSQVRKQDTKPFDIITAPTQSLLQKWLRDIHGWHIITIPVVTMGYTFKVLKVWKKDFDPDLEIETPPYSGVDAYDYKDHEAALEEGLKAALNLL